ncbi:hypothetical protein GCM10010399_64080 [Dactylosporangium fulvum]|uniref:Uncharacterized protein n=1 Tax=Dactylosporangium fulvum TaxID=53359 RepID=A0ABY5W9S4_9ACTN|nr:hypothetical protein [Dactylosporangium fulvum]UWP85769.1 hypothetical protein Dfulv_16615 [Dactylosporangium fulvum]
MYQFLKSIVALIRHALGCWHRTARLCAIIVVATVAVIGMALTGAL